MNWAGDKRVPNLIPIIRRAIHHRVYCTCKCKVKPSPMLFPKHLSRVINGNAWFQFVTRRVYREERAFVHFKENTTECSSTRRVNLPTMLRQLKRIVLHFKIIDDHVHALALVCANVSRFNSKIRV